VPVRFRPEVQEKAAFQYELSGFFSETNEVCHQTVAKYPYKLARLVHHRYNMKKRWWIAFYAWDVSTDKLKRYRMFEPLNRIKDKHTRIDRANEIIKVLNAQLKAGKVLGKDKVTKNVAVNKISKLSLLQAIQYVEDQKKANGHRLQYYRSFRTLRSNLTAWLEFKVVPDFPVHQFNEQDAHEFFTYLRDEKKHGADDNKKKLSNKTINGLISNLGIAFKFLEKQSDTVIWKKLPLRNISMLPVVAKMNPAYSNDQITAIKLEIVNSAANAAKHRRLGYIQLQLFISFIYYLLARPKEIQQLKVGDIDIEGKRVFIKGEISKNKTDDMVELSPQLIEIIKEFGIMDYPQHFYIFGKKGVPGEELVNDNFFWAKHHNVLKRTGLLKVNDNFSLYSYKHSGAVSLYMATKDIKLCQRQMRHKSVEQTNHYLRDLGVLRDFNQLTTWKGAV
jgi:integrase